MKRLRLQTQQGKSLILSNFFVFSKATPTAVPAKKPVRVLGDTSSDDESNTCKISKSSVTQEKKEPQKPVIVPKPKFEEKKEVKTVPKEKPVPETHTKQNKPVEKEESPKAKVRVLGDSSSDEEDNSKAVSKPLAKKPVKVLGDPSSDEEDTNDPPTQPKKEPIAQEKIVGDTSPTKPKEKETPPQKAHHPIQKQVEPKKAVLGDSSSDDEDKAPAKPSAIPPKECIAQEKIIGGDSPDQVKKPVINTPSDKSKEEKPKRAVLGDPSSEEEDNIAPKADSSSKTKIHVKVLGDPASDEETDPKPEAPSGEPQGNHEEEDKDTMPDDIFEQRMKERDSK